MFKPSYFFAYQQVPVLGYKFRKKPMLFFGIPSDRTAAVVREASAVPLTLAWTVSVVNDRKVMRVRELTLHCYGPGAAGSAEDRLWATVAVEPDALSAASGESHKNLDYWSALAPKVAETSKTMARRVAEKFAAAGG
jgi:hypothetical protein